MTVTKEALANVQSCELPTSAVAAEMEALNCFSKTPLSQEQVYLFSVRLCDNQVDRDEEYFSRNTLEQLAPLFVGKSGIFDHSWSAKHQTARIYRTEVVSEPGVVMESGEAICYLKGYAYMLRNEANADLIAEIEAGIKKEVSVSCAVSRRICSICGYDVQDQIHCSHAKGHLYEGKRCVVCLEDPTDAFEWSFVAVPAQRNAGVLKAMKQQETLEKLLGSERGQADWVESIQQLQKEAACGRRYLETLRSDVIRLGLLAQSDMEVNTLSAIVRKLEEPELLKLKTAYESSVSQRLPLKTQLQYGEPSKSIQSEDQVFCI